VRGRSQKYEIIFWNKLCLIRGPACSHQIGPHFKKIVKNLLNRQYALTKIEPHPSRRRGMLSFSVPHGQPVIPIYASAFITGRKHFGLDTHHYLVEG
jgi:hypothetical protein